MSDRSSTFPSVTVHFVPAVMVEQFRDWNVLAIDDLEQPPVEAAWRRFREDGGGRLERVVMATGEHYAYSSVGLHTSIRWLKVASLCGGWGTTVCNDSRRGPICR